MKQSYIILLLFLGFLFMPSTAMACGMHNSKPSSEKEIATNQKESKSCCGSDHSKENDGKGCEGKCNDSKCGCASNCTSVSVSFLSDSSFSIPNVYFTIFDKVRFSYTTPSILDGFYSIWLIPKIS